MSKYSGRPGVPLSRLVSLRPPLEGVTGTLLLPWPLPAPPTDDGGGGEQERCCMAGLEIRACVVPGWLALGLAGLSRNLEHLQNSILSNTHTHTHIVGKQQQHCS